MEPLTTREEEIMQILWSLKKAFVKEIIQEMKGKKPPYNTISSVVRLLEEKGFIKHKKYGQTHQYYPKISKTRYKKFAFKEMMKDYFDNSYKNVVSFMVEKNKLEEEQISAIEEIIKQGKKKAKNKK